MEAQKRGTVPTVLPNDEQLSLGEITRDSRCLLEDEKHAKSAILQNTVPSNSFHESPCYPYHRPTVLKFHNHLAQTRREPSCCRVQYGIHFRTAQSAVTKWNITCIFRQGAVRQTCASSTHAIHQYCRHPLLVRRGKGGN